MSHTPIFTNTHANLILNNIPLDSAFQYEILTPTYLDQTVDLFTSSFCRSEPMTQYLEMDETKYKIFARAVAEQACKDQLSIIALDGKKVVAIALTEDLAEPGALPDFDPKFIYIVSLLESIGQDLMQQSLKKGEIAHLFITAVDEQYRHRGLSKQVNFRAMDRAAEQGFKFVYCELTNYYNEKGIIPHLKNPKRLIGSCFYQDFIYQGIKPFANLAGGANSYLWGIQTALLK